MASPISPKRNKRNRPMRSDSSLLGTIKTLVTTPLSWFASPDSLDVQTTSGSKRRRSVPMDTRPDFIQDDNDSARSKRIRIDSLDVTSLSRSSHLDPPHTLFQPNGFRERNPPNPLHTMHTNHDISNYPGPRDGRASYSPFRNALSLQSASRESSLNITKSYEASFGPPRDRSLPPLSTQPSFRLRSSLPPLAKEARELSEPPALSSLASSPMFVRAPPSPNPIHDSGYKSNTLGSLFVQRGSKSPSHTHSSLLFGTSSIENAVSPSPVQSVAEKALHGLDIYRTPLLPAHLRSASAKPPATFPFDGPDLFRSHRRAKLVLMQDCERIDPSIPKRKKHRTIENKPYSGQGGIRKLLTKRQLETDEEGSVQVSSVVADSPLSTGSGVSSLQTKETEQVRHHQPLTKVETSLPTPSNVSSLRVGRVRMRTSIPRPRSRPMQLKFSAAFDDDETVDEPFAEKGPEICAQDEIVFKPPEGFTFAKESVSITPPKTIPKEPPILNLPFSLTRRSPNTTHYVQEEELVHLSPSLPSHAQVSIISRPMDVQKDSTDAEARLQPSLEGSPNVPNFFATSAAFSKPLEFVVPSFDLSIAQGNRVNPPEALQEISHRHQIQSVAVGNTSFHLISRLSEKSLAEVKHFHADPPSEPRGTSLPSPKLRNQVCPDLSVTLDPGPVQALDDLKSISTAAMVASSETLGQPTKSSFSGQPSTEHAPPFPTLADTKMGTSLSSSSEFSSNTALFQFVPSSTPHPFSFDSPLQRPVTPPKALDQEFRMDESPTRDIQTNGESKPQDSRVAFGFSFPPLPSRNAHPFAFEATTAEKEQDTSKPFTFGHLPMPSPSTFAFGKPAARSESFPANRFAAVSDPVPIATYAPAPAPISPSFNSPSFSFDPTSNPFAFITTQPTPSATTPFDAVSGGSRMAVTTNQLFTIGAAPSAPGARPTRKLPTRRMGAKR